MFDSLLLEEGADHVRLVSTSGLIPRPRSARGVAGERCQIGCCGRLALRGGGLVVGKKNLALEFRLLRLELVLESPHLQLC